MANCQGGADGETHIPGTIVTGKKTILLVEDEALIAMNEARLLTGEGYEVIQAFTGRKAMEVACTPGTKIDLILMDIDLGSGMDGTQAAQEILTGHDVPILFVSSHTEKEIVDRTEKITSYGYVVKDSGSVVLLASIKMAFRLHAAHRALQASEDRYSKAFHTSPDAVNLNRLNDGVFLAINEGFTKATGYTNEEVLGRSSRSDDLRIWVREEDREKLVAGLKECGEVTGLEAEFRSKDGTLKTGMMSARVIDVGEEKCILSVTRDITERKKADELLRASQALMRVLFDNAKDNVMVNEVGPDGVPGPFVDVNESTCKALGYSREELLQMSPMDITEAGDPAEMLRISFQLLNERHAHYEVRGRRKDGGRPLFDVQAQLVTSGSRKIVISISRDITERKALENVRERRLSYLSGRYGFATDITFHDLFDVKEIQEIQDAFAEATGVASVITDTTGVPITTPSGFCDLCQDIIRKTEKGRQNCQYSDRILGMMNPGGPIAQPCLSGGLWDGGTSIQVGDLHLANWLIGQVLDDSIDQEKMLAYGKEIGADEHEFKEALGKVTRMPKGQFLKICNALFLIARLLSRLALQNVQQARHIAARERAEEALRGMVKQKETLMQELQHRVKNNLGIVSSLLALEKPRLADSQARQVFTNAENRIRALSRIYEQLYRSDALARIDLCPYISELAQGLVENYALEGGRIGLTLQVEDMQMDLKRAVPLALILNELITNAMKYAYPGGAQGNIRIGLKRADGGIILSVSDNGVGLPRDFVLEKSGSMGLRLVQMLVEQLDGALTMTSDHGTDWTIRFPA